MVQRTSLAASSATQIFSETFMVLGTKVDWNDVNWNAVLDVMGSFTNCSIHPLRYASLRANPHFSSHIRCFMSKRIHFATRKVQIIKTPATESKLVHPQRPQTLHHRPHNIGDGPLRNVDIKQKCALLSSLPHTRAPSNGDCMHIESISGLHLGSAGLARLLSEFARCTVRP